MYTPVVTIEKNATIEAASAVLIRRGINHLPVTDASGRLSGIVTSWDIAKAVACRLERLEEIITTDVVCTAPEESIEQATEKMTKNSISALPVVDADNSSWDHHQRRAEQTVGGEILAFSFTQTGMSGNRIPVTHLP